MRLTRSMATFGLLGLTLLSLSSPAYAYIDPGVGSVLVQTLFAGLAGVALVVRLFWKQLVDKFKSLFSTSKKSN